MRVSFDWPIGRDVKFWLCIRYSLVTGITKEALVFGIWGCGSLRWGWLDETTLNLLGLGLFVMSS